ncbi:DUF3489 domain-containing protein [Caldichromatium japonicum]|uniref:DUF3489 domain-containing protein n=2 Tax=Caldichromatium japonicum TaxID=2699430 RepID=A0A6G7VGP3_9GAMM|nr:DUF3489 domain-containing protein [Caldichromatium japonicum]
MIASLAQRGLIEQQGGQWRLTKAAIAIIKGEVKPEDVVPPPTDAPQSATPALTDTQDADDAYDRAVQCAKEGATIRKNHGNAVDKALARNSKLALVIEMLQRRDGATIHQICAATGWQAHTVRGTLAGALKKRLGLNIVSEKIEGPAGTPGAGQRLYRIAEEVTA